MKIDIKNFLSQLGFKPREGTEDMWFKIYQNRYQISVSVDSANFKNSKIDYGEKIRYQRATTCNFGQPESFVVFECVNRLLEKGYKPENILLEKNWPLGHKTKGFLDILVYNDSGEAFLMIECKTYGEEHRKEKEKMFKDGGQLFSYLIQEKSTEYLCLYSSEIHGGEIVFENDIIQVGSTFANTKNQQEAFEAWAPQIFETKGIFETDATPFHIKFTGILKKDLRDLKAEEGGYIFNRFAEILRRNVVSDKTNAFNKIFNLFLCKIVDEFERSDDEKTQFQWEESEDNEKVMLRLNDLYKRGMDKYLGLKISAVTEDELEQELSKVNTDQKTQAIKELFIKQKLYSGNEFAFKEVFDKKTFEQNAVVVKEVVKLLENFRIKYSTKQQFLGDFFEKLLNTGIKQESGQFFTPIPITRFICRSIPIWDIIGQKNENREENFLPYIIDYASGSGHFLTEVMGEINSHLSKINDSWIKGGGLAKRNFNSLKSEYLWAKEYVYGIEKDYRLAKTTKISTFLNGDGDANIICGDGLDSFSSSQEYKGKLLETVNANDNEEFDILVANPPYSVSGFKNTLKNGKASFSLYNRLTEQSSEIECLFIERAKQLLKEGGYAGIILPVSVLTNSGIYTDTRELLFKYFEIRAIVAFSSNTFMATRTNTVTLFLRKRNDNVWSNISDTVDIFLKTHKDITCNDIEKPFSRYVAYAYPDSSFEDYVSLLKGDFDSIRENLLLKKYKKLFGELQRKDDSTESEIENAKLLELINQTEKSKLVIFLLSFNQKVALVRSGEKKAEKKFLGYEFSSRRGHEGIKVYKTEGGHIKSSLYNEEVLDDSSKVNSYILRVFKGEEIKTIDPKLSNNLIIQDLHAIVDFESAKFEQKIALSFKKKAKLKSKYPIEPLQKHCSIVDNGTNAPQDNKYFEEGEFPFIRAGNLNRKDAHGFLIADKDNYVNKKAVEDCGLKMFKEGTILFPKSGQSVNTNNIAKLREDSYVVNHLACLYDADKNFLNYLYYYLEDYKISNLVPVDSNYPSINLPEIKELLIPVPPNDIVTKIVSKILKVEDGAKTAVNETLKNKDKIKSIFDGVSKEHKSIEKINDLRTLLQRGKSPKYGDSNLHIIKSGQARGYFDFDFSEKYFASSTFEVDDRKLQKGDILINSTGVGTAGRVTYFDLDGDYVVDSHITILRPDRTKVIPKFLLYTIANIGFDNLEKMAEGQSGQVELSLEIIKNIKVTIPPLPAQEKIMEEIDTIDKKLKSDEAILKLVSEQKANILKEALY